MKKKWWILGAIGVLLAGGGYYGYQQYFSVQDAANVGEVPPPPSFPSAVVDRGEVKKSIYATGVVEAKAREEVKAEGSGKIQQLLVKEGQQVKKGDVLFTIDGTDATLEYQKHEISLERLTSELADLKDRKPVITSTARGKVKEVLIKEGESVTPETVVAKLIDPDHLKIVGQFSSVEIDEFKVGMKVRIFLTGSLTYTNGVVSKIDRVGEKKEGAPGFHGVEVLVDNPGSLYVNDFGQVEYRNASGEIFMSQVPTKFEIPDEIELTAGTHGKVGKVLIDTNDNIQPKQQIATMDLKSSELEIREKEIALKESQLILGQKKQELSKKQVVAPTSGTVTKLDVKVGDTVDPGKAAMVIMDASTVYMKAYVDEIDIPSIKTGQSVDVYVTAFGNKAFPGTVVEIPQEGTQQDKTVRFEVKVAIKDSSSMKHGMTGDCDIHIVKKDDVPRLPLNAVEIMEEGKGTVMVKDPKTGQPMPKEVQVGIEGAEFVEILGGLNAGDEVLITNGGGGGGMEPMPVG
ncbi:efflux RND transporter periplasmic adaptor subunit [Brevibacillus dissolubilis]|uniref:efflux RND transporter periplasmic adaptor subunit n=1 Tax=Brevibacillus dissolubilis TaxID=1844116 RepID=UPI001117A76A|nr:efflux RND transporter periplasmic adaptor subunit [Brevibacillus dissolubilis]